MTACETARAGGRGYIDAAYTLGRQAAAGAGLEELAGAAVETLGRELDCPFAAAYFACGRVQYSAATAEAGSALAGMPELLDGLTAAPAFLPATAAPLLCGRNGSSAGSSLPAAATRLAADMGIAAVYPLLVAGNLSGLLALGARSDGGGYHRDELEFIAVVGSLLATRSAELALADDLDRSRDTITRNDRLSSIGAMTAGLAHEIRNPLVSIRTFTQLLPEKYDDDEFRSTFLDLTLSEIDRVCTLVGELLTFARPDGSESGQLVDLNESLERTCLLLRSQARSLGVELSFVQRQDSPYVHVDEDRLKQVVMNIVLNAIQACNGGGTVEVSGNEYMCDGERFVCIEISDDGPGIDESTRRRIFEPFFTTRGEGTGLGLAIANEIVAGCGGHIEVESTLGEGSRFSVNLPAEPTKADDGVCGEATIGHADRTTPEQLANG